MIKVSRLCDGRTEMQERFEHQTSCGGDDALAAMRDTRSLVDVAVRMRAHGALQVDTPSRFERRPPSDKADAM